MAHAISSVWQRRTPEAGRRCGFQADRPNQNWVTDITAINTDEGTLYLAAIEDLFSRNVVARAIDAHMETSLVTRALKSAIAVRNVAPGLLRHSDRGCQYTLNEY